MSLEFQQFFKIKVHGTAKGHSFPNLLMFSFFSNLLLQLDNNQLMPESKKKHWAGGRGHDPCLGTKAHAKSIVILESLVT